LISAMGFGALLLAIGHVRNIISNTHRSTSNSLFRDSDDLQLESNIVRVHELVYFTLCDAMYSRYYNTGIDKSVCRSRVVYDMVYGLCWYR